jgi:hypothetical protein
MTLWHNQLAQLSNANPHQLKKQAHGIRNMEPHQQCNHCLQGQMTKQPHYYSGSNRRGKYVMELHNNIAGPFNKGFHSSHY